MIFFQQKSLVSSSDVAYKSQSSGVYEGTFSCSSNFSKNLAEFTNIDDVVPQFSQTSSTSTTVTHRAVLPRERSDYELVYINFKFVQS